MSAFLDALPSAVPGSDVVETKMFRVGTGAMPFLADHGFHGMIVAPGSLSVALALRVFNDTRWLPVVRFTKVKFHQPLILSGPPIELAVELAWHGEQRAHCTLRETQAGRASEAPDTTLEITGGFEHDLAPARPAVTPEIFQHRAGPPQDGATFYRRLRENGNQYGPRFQGLQQLWRADDEVLARLSLARGTAEEFFLDPIVLDSALQSLAVFGLEQNGTLVLRAIDEALLRRPSGSTQGWVTARLRPGPRGESDPLIGDIEVRDDAGECWLELRGVTWSFHDTKHSAASHEAPAPTSLVVAATFTAEPIADVLRFWSETRALPTRVSFAPYGQVFQSLLDPQSEFRRNRDGCNVLLVNLADWATLPASAAAPLDRARADACFDGLARCTLPNGLEVAQLNRHETDYVYREIFQDRCYLRHGIRLPETGTVIDIGANIGLFALFVHTEAPNATVFAFEPSPAAFRVLKANCEAYGPKLEPFNLGVAERRGDALLTCYEKSSVFSSFHANADEDRQAIRAVAANVAREHSAKNVTVATPDDLLDELLVDRLNAQTIACPMLSVSDIIRDQRLERVDLLKIDAEKCEEEILRGIEEEHWPRIDQIVVEVHDRTRALLGRVQEMLTLRGFHCAVVEEALLAGSGLFNVYATRADPASLRPEESAARRMIDAVRRTAGEFSDALAIFARATVSPTLIAITPQDPAGQDSATVAALAEVERSLLQRVRAVPRVHAVSSGEILARYPAQTFHQPDAHQLGHVAYTPEGFAAIGTSVFRLLAALRRAPFKVIALDCDHTLWQGGCGDDGALGITVTPPHRALQEFMIRQRDAGMLLCLCSKNDEANVWAVFERNPGMVLKREHITAARINWDVKSANLRSLAAELNVSVDSMLFLDDNPTERAEVRANCPEVAVLPLPADSADFPHFLNHVWAFDQAGVTADDRSRAQRMAEGEQREKFRSAVPTLQSFIAGLDLKVNIFIPEPDDLARVAQLTQRTNQFNFSTLRRTEAELRQFLEKPNHHCLAVHVTDRFGDYGLVGVVLYETDGDGLRIDTFLLSCRVLGRGVEHQIVAGLGRRALALGKSAVEFALHPTERNQPARDFAASLEATPTTGAKSGMTHRIAAERAAASRYDATRPAASHDTMPAVANTAPAALPRRPEDFEIIAALDDAGKISAAVETHRLREAHFATNEDSVPADTVSGKLLRIWRKTLGNPNLGLDDKFMEAGGTSLTAVQIVAAIRKELQVPLSVVAFFESPTVRRLTEKLTAGDKPASTGQDALQRGARRAQRSGRKTP